MPTVKIEEDQMLHYQLLEGDPALPYLVFLHEGLGCTAMWRDFPELLCKATGCPGLVYDRLGYGKSSALPQSRTFNREKIYSRKNDGINRHPLPP